VEHQLEIIFKFDMYEQLSRWKLLIRITSQQSFTIFKWGIKLFMLMRFSKRIKMGANFGLIGKPYLISHHFDISICFLKTD